MIRPALALILAVVPAVAFQSVQHAVRPATAITMSASSENDSNRRSFVTQSVAAAAAFSLGLGVQQPAVAADVDYKAVAQDIMDLVKADPDKGPTLVRLAWHSSGTYDKVTKTGGSGGGTIRFDEELAHGGNAGLKATAVKWMEPMYEKYDGLSHADLYTLAGGTYVKNKCCFVVV